MSDRAQVLLDTAKFFEAVARHVSNEARKVEGLDAEAVGDAVRSFYARSKAMKDTRAALMAPAAPAPGRGGEKTNVGDPNKKGAGGKAKR